MIFPKDRSALLLTALAAVVVAVLLQGGLAGHAPAPAGATEAPAPEASALAEHPDLEKTPLSYYSDYWLQLGSRARAGLVQLGPRKTPALRVAPDLALSTFESGEGGVSAPLGSGALDGPSRLLAVDPRAGLALFELHPPLAGQALEPSDPASLRAGMLVAAVAVDARDRLQVMPGHLASAGDPSLLGDAAAAGDALDVLVPLSPSTRVAAIVDLDGRLVGAAFRSKGRTRLVSAESLLRTVKRLRADPSCRSVDVANLEEAVRKRLGVEGGVVVARVDASAFRPEPSLHAGDVLLEWGGHKVKDAAEFERLYHAEQPGAVVPYLVRRGRRALRGGTVMPGPDCRPLGEPPASLPRAGLTLSWDSSTDADSPSPAWRVDQVAPESPAQQAGMEPGDRILGADGSNADREDVRRGLEAFEKQGRPIVLTLQRGDRVRLVALPPAVQAP